MENDKITYEEYKNQRQKEFNALPIFFVFGEKQFEEELMKRGLTLNDVDKVCSLPGGGFCLKSDFAKIKEFIDKPDQLDELMKDTEFAESAFIYEMRNHEYHINWQGDWDVCSCFGDCEYGEDKDYSDYLREMGYSNEIIQIFAVARAKFIKQCNDNDWY